MYILQLQYAHARGEDVFRVELEASEDSLLEDLSPRIKSVFSLELTDFGYHSFHANGLIYVPGDSVSQVTEMEFETWEPSYEGQEEPNWQYIYRSSESIRLNEVFTVLGSAVIYEQGYNRIRIELAGYVED